MRAPPQAPSAQRSARTPWRLWLAAVAFALGCAGCIALGDAAAWGLVDLNVQSAARRA